MNWNFTLTGTVISTVECPDGTLDVSIVNMDSYTDAEGVVKRKQSLFFLNTGRIDVRELLPHLKKGARVGAEGYITGDEYIRNEARPEWVTVNGPTVHIAEDGSPYTAVEGTAVSLKVIAPPIDFDDYKEQEDVLTMLLIGQLGRDAELKYTQSGLLLCESSIRVKRFRYVDVGGERQREEVTTWWRITLWGESAERAVKWWKKNKALILKVTPRVEANGAPRTWTNNAGDEVASYEANVLWWTFVPSESVSATTARDEEYVAPQQSQFDEDIPF